MHKQSNKTKITLLFNIILSGLKYAFHFLKKKSKFFLSKNTDKQLLSQERLTDKANLFLFVKYI